MPCNHPRVAYLGPAGTYTHQAASKIFNPDDYCVDPAELIPDVFSCVASGEALYGVVPISNSTKGVVRATLASFMKIDRLFDNVRICGEIYVRVNHCLLGWKPAAASAAIISPTARRTSAFCAASVVPFASSGDGGAPASGACTPTPAQPTPPKPRSVPLVSLKHINKVYSHEQALQQCSVFLDAFLKHAERIEVSSTSKAAELAYEDKTGASAGISSIMATEVYDVGVLATDVQNAAVNATAFLILRKMSPGDDIGRIPKDIPNHPEATRWKGYMSFTIPEETPERLGEVLVKFMAAGIWVTNVHSEPCDGVPFGFDYFVTIETVPPKRTGSSALEKLVKEISTMCQTFKWFGYWPKIDWKTNS